MSSITQLLVDLDGTLYPIENGYEAYVRRNIFEFMHQELGVPSVEEAKRIWQPLFAKHNQSLKGLREGGFKFDTEQYWDFIRRDADKFLTPDPKVRACLQCLPQTKWILTNCNEKHARIALEYLGLEDCFEGVLGADFMGEQAKPQRAVFERALKHIGTQPQHCGMLEDSLKNLKQAKEMGIHTILVAGPTLLEEAGGSLDSARLAAQHGVNAAITVLHEDELRQQMPHLWQTAPLSNNHS
jgi:putative hydrolase of the HAD superfamily